MTQTMVRKLVKGYGEFFLPTDNMLDQTVSKEILDGEVYPKIASEVSVIWDVGANLGAAALWFAKIHPSAEIHCFEPSQDTVWECLAENTNRIRSRCRLYPYGLAGNEEKRSMNAWGDATVTRSCNHQSHELAMELFSCKFRTPPDCKDVTIIKIDTEGCELEILRALGEARHQVPVFYLEYHSDNDRRVMDRLLPDHQLVRSKAERKHRGNLVYLHKTIRTREDRYEIT